MNLQWLTDIYDSFGTPYPRASLAVVMILGAICFGAVWLFAAKQVEKERRTSTAPAVSGPATTSAPNSPSVTGGNNDIHYDQSTHTDEKSKPPKKE
jgi:hypothetical protein